MARYPRAQWIPSTHFGYPQGATGQNKPKFIIIHGTGYQAGQSAVSIAQDFAGFGPYPGSGSNPNSVHFAIDRNGVVTQIVDTGDAAWGNGVITAGHDPWWHDQPNEYTVSIEHANDGNNSLAPTPAQLASSFALVLWLCQTLGIPARKADANGGITGHFSIDPVNRSRCPGPNYPFEDLFAFLEGASKVQWMAPGAVAISEFARLADGSYLHATCVEAAALMCAICQEPSFKAGVGSVGPFLQKMVQLWQSYGDGVTSQGASSYVDATRWLRGLGYKVDEDVFDPADWWEVLLAGLEEHSVFLVGVNNAQGLHGDEPGVHNHGLCALGIDGNGNIICGDPDNSAANVNMPGNPYGNFVTYSKQDLANGGICSLTRVYPMALSIADTQGHFTAIDASHWKCVKTGFTVGMGILNAYVNWPAAGALNGLTALGLPLSNEMYPKSGVAIQHFERGVLVWDPNRTFDNPDGATGPVYLAHMEVVFPPAPAPVPTPPPPSGGPVIPSDVGPKLAEVLTVLGTASADVAAVQKELGL